MPASSTPIGHVSPPDLGPMEDSDPVLVTYLRRLGLWMVNQLQGKVPVNTASPMILLQSPGGSVFKIVVSDAGVISAVGVPLGSKMATKV